MSSGAQPDHVVARGVVAFDAEELPALIGRSSHHLPAEQRREVVHADDLVAVRQPVADDNAMRSHYT
jgi:glutamate 5-kinase